MPFFTSPAAHALFPQVRQRVLAVLFGAPQRSFYTQEIIGLAQSGNGAVQRELQALAQSGLISVQRQGKQTHYQANLATQGAPELCDLVQKTLGLPSVLHAVLEPVRERIVAACLYGDAASMPQRGVGPVQLLVVSDALSARELQAAFRGIAALGPVSCRVASTRQMAAARQDSASTLAAILRQPHQWLVGRADDWQTGAS